MSVKWDQSVFDETLRKYLERTSRTLPEALNTKGFYIERRSVIETPKVDRNKIQSELGRIMPARRKRNKHMSTTRFRGALAPVYSVKHRAPWLALILNKRRGKKGEKGLYGYAMNEKGRELLASRMRSIAFLKSIWLPGIKALAPYADKRGAPAQESGVKQYGQPKGGATPATYGMKCRVIFWGILEALRDNKDLVGKYARPAQERAFAFETASMTQYLEDKMKGDAYEFNALQKK